MVLNDCSFLTALTEAEQVSSIVQSVELKGRPSDSLVVED